MHGSGGVWGVSAFGLEQLKNGVCPCSPHNTNSSETCPGKSEETPPAGQRCVCLVVREVSRVGFSFSRGRGIVIVVILFSLSQVKSIWNLKYLVYAQTNY